MLITFPKEMNPYHLTTTDRQAIKQGLAQGLTQFESGRNSYKVVRSTKNIKNVEISQTKTDLFNKAITRKFIVTAITKA